MAILRPADRRESLAGSGIPTGVALKRVIPEGSTNLIALPDGTPLVLWGVRPHAEYPEVGIVWLVATVPAERHAIALHRTLGPQLEEALATFPTLWNIVWEGNGLHVQWLRRVGAEFIAHHPNIGPLGEPFLEFIITRNNLTTLARGTA